MPSSSDSWWQGWRIFLLIAVVAIIANAFCLRAGFYMDDAGFITGTQKLEHWYDVEQGDWWTAPKFQRVPAFLYARIHAVFGASPMAFHALNLALHALIACLVFPTVSALLRALHTLHNGRTRRRAALFAALVFACHPLCTEAVHYTRCSMIQLVTLFSIAAAWSTLWLIRRPGVLPALALAVSVLLASHSKGPGFAHAATNVLLVLLVALRLRASDGFRWTRARATLAIAGAALAVFAMLPLLGKYWRIFEAKLAMSDSFLDHVLTQGRVFFLYFQKVIAPVNLGSDHLLTWSDSGDTWAIVLTIAVGLFALAAFAGVFTQRWKPAAVLLCLAIAPLLVRFLYENGEILVEYRAYPAMPWFAALIGIGLVLAQQKRPELAKYLTLVVIVGCTFLSVMRSAAWQHASVLNQQVLGQYPLNNRARTQLQYFHYSTGTYQEVFSLQEDIVAAFNEIQAFNEASDNGRYYDLQRARKNYFNGEQFVTYALAEVAEVDTAIEYANRIIERHFPGDLSHITKDDIRDSGMASLLTARSELAKHAEHYREIKRKRGDLRVDGAMPDTPE